MKVHAARLPAEAHLVRDVFNIVAPPQVLRVHAPAIATIAMKSVIVRSGRSAPSVQFEGDVLCEGGPTSIAELENAISVLADSSGPFPTPTLRAADLCPIPRYLIFGHLAPFGFQPVAMDGMGTDTGGGGLGSSGLIAALSNDL